MISWINTIRKKLDWFPLFFARISIGAFFCISGFNKLFVEASQQELLKTFMHANIPYPMFNAIFVPGVEFIGGAFLILGLATFLTSGLLIILLLVAIITDGIHKIPAGLGPLDWLDYFLYLPEVLYIYFLIWFGIKGGGCISLDCLLCKLFCKSKK